MTMKTLNFQGAILQITRSQLKNKKLKIVITNPSHKGRATFHIGDSRYQNYADKSGLLPSSMLHGDEKRRRAYKNRHRRNVAKGGITPATLADYILW